jgi:hypothetical protein
MARLLHLTIYFPIDLHNILNLKHPNSYLRVRQSILHLTKHSFGKVFFLEYELKHASMPTTVANMKKLN